jgi:hypothetical protein
MVASVARGPGANAEWVTESGCPLGGCRNKDTKWHESRSSRKVCDHAIWFHAETQRRGVWD